VPIPPFQPNATVPVPAPTAPSSTARRKRLAERRSTCSRVTARARMSFSAPSLVSPDHRVDAARVRVGSSTWSSSASATRGTHSVQVSRIGVSISPSSRTCVTPISLPKPLPTWIAAGTFSWNRLPPCGRTAVTPVRIESPSRTVTWPTRTPATSVIAFSGPGRQDAGRDADLTRARHRATGGGAVLAYDATSLEPRWGWAALGAPATAAAGSLLGDRFYLALADTAGAAGGEVLIRDLQTGRVLSRAFFPVPLVGLLPDPGGGLVALLREEGGGAVMGLRHAQGDLPIRWRHTLAELGLEAEPQLRGSARTPRIAVFGEGNENGLHVLDAETGRRLGRVREAVLDAGFGDDGALYLLDATSIRVVEPVP
jgi:hypothetical protein